VKGNITATRNEELKVRWSAFIYQAWFSFLAGAIPIIVSLVSFATLAAVKTHPTIRLNLPDTVLF
jgi:hypothetical protein